MADTTVKGLNVKFGIDDVEFDNSIKGVNKAIKLVGTELKNLDKQLKLDPKNVELLGKKLEALQQQSKLAKDRLKMYNDELQQMDKSKVGSDEWIKLQKQISNAETKVATINSEIEKTEKRLKEAEKAGSKAFQEMSKSAEEAGKKIKKVGEGIEDAGKMIAPFSIAAKAGLLGSTLLATNLGEAVNKTEVAFGDAAQSILDFTKNSSTTMGETQAEVLDVAATFGLLGFEAEKVPDILTRIADVSSLQNRSFKDVAADFTSAINGSTEVVEKYGIKIKQSDLATFVFEQGLVSSKDQANKFLQGLDSTGKQALIYEKIMFDTANAQGDFANNSGTVAVGTKILWAQIKELGAQLGQFLLPAVMNVVGRLNEFIEKIRSLSPKTQELIVKVMLFVAALAPLLLIIGKLVSIVGTLVGSFGAIGSVLMAIFSPIGLIVGLVAALAAAFVHLFKTNEDFRIKVLEVVNNIKESLMPVFQGLSDFIQGFVIPVFLDFVEYILPELQKIFEIVMGVINDLVLPIFDMLVRIIADNVIPIFKEVWKFIETALLPIFKLIVSYYTDFLIPVFVFLAKTIGSVLMPVFEVIFNFVGGLLIGIFQALNSTVSFLSDVFKFLWEKIQDGIGFFQQLWNKIKESPLSVLIDAFNALKNAVGWVIDKVESLFGWLGKVGDIAGDVIGGIGDFFGGIGNSIGGLFSAGGAGFDAGGFGDITIENTFNISNNGPKLDNQSLRDSARAMTDQVVRELGRRGLTRHDI